MDGPLAVQLDKILVKYFMMRRNKCFSEIRRHKIWYKSLGILYNLLFCLYLWSFSLWSVSVRCPVRHFWSNLYNLILKKDWKSKQKNSIKLELNRVIWQYSFIFVIFFPWATFIWFWVKIKQSYYWNALSFHLNWTAKVHWQPFLLTYTQR
jgi:hypothetical protein